ncbi:MAG: outer membrane protein assembly factor BamD [Bacteroidetes bacterium]|nr:outer membrane protein assembly factor BamD [Bacteroidota bacterium]MCL2302445.1 outer membrane protein assembly factor BamD [Lentimicrobiaceae bacterium]
MKKIRIIDFNLLIFLILCFSFGKASATTEGEFLPKDNHVCFFEVDETNETTVTSAERKTKEKKPRRSGRRGKVNFETFREYYEKAMNLYNKKAWLSAARIFEQLYPLSIGTPLGDTILFYFADSYFQNRDYQMAAFHFRDYVRRYPGTERTELAALNAVKAMYFSSPEYYLDQFITLMAIDEVNLFIQNYPYSKHIEECNEILDALRDKLAKKEMEMVRMYYRTGNYEAAQIMARNFLKTYSYSKYAPEVLFILVRNNFDFARRSVEHRKYHRFKDVLDAFETLQARYPESRFIADAKKIADEAANQIKKLDERKK